MKIEKRGKYPGVKVHLDVEEVKILIEAVPMTVPNGVPFLILSQKLGKKLGELVQKEPDTLSERTPEQIQEVVEAEFLTAQQKLEALKGGKDWKHFTKGELHHHG